jgi:uroporphyrinogen decarboxylase
VEPDPQLVRRFGRAAMPFFPSSPADYVFQIDPATNTYVDEWGTKYYMPPDGYYFDMCENPLASAETEADLRGYRWPNPTDPTRIAGLPEQIKAVRASGEQAIMMMAAIGGLFEHAWYLLGLEQTYINLAINQDFMEALTDRILEWQVAYWDTTLDAVGPYVDLVQLNEDLGSQNGPLISPAVFRRIYKPRLRQLVDSIKRKTDARLYIHSCGSVYTFIPDLIECGIEVLNPVQVSAVDMDTARLKREFGKDLTFWGGGCDTVVLQYGTPDKVKDEVRRRMEDLAPGGGFVFGSVHNIQANVPPANIVALFEAAQEYGGYPA